MDEEFESSEEEFDDEGESWNAFEEGERLANEEMVQSWGEEETD